LLKVLPYDISRILWLDADLIINKNIDSFYNQTIDGYSLVACDDHNQNIGKLRDNLGMSKEQKYFNAGILLFNIDYLRSHFSPDYLIEYAVNNKEKIIWHDQDVLNAVCGTSAKILENTIYNRQIFSYSVITEDELNQISNSACIIHFLGKIKPWYVWYSCRAYSLWREAAKKANIYNFFFFFYHDFITFLRSVIRKVRRSLKHLIVKKSKPN